MRGRRLGAVIAGIALAAGVARGDGAPDKDLRLTERRQAEVKALLPLLRTAVKEDHRRQAWYVAWRIASAAHDHEEARAALTKWKETEILHGTAPTKAFVAKRDAVLKGEGDAYAQEARLLQGQGAKVVETFAVMDRALSYGSRATDLLAALDASGHEWAGTWGAQTKEAVAQAVGPIRKSVVFLPEWDSALLAARSLGWGDARVVSVAGWRLVLSGDLAAAGRRATFLTAMEAFFVARMGSTWKEPKGEKDEPDLPTLYLCPEADGYLRLVGGFFGDRKLSDADMQEVAKSSGQAMWWRDRVLLVEKHRDAPWAGDDANLAFWFAQALARRHLFVGGGLAGRGAWILDAVGGLFEGFQAKGATDGAIDLDRCRHLAVARALREKGALLPWDKLLEIDHENQRTRSRETVKIRFQGADVVAKEVDVVAAQGTALALAIWSAPDGKGPKRLANLVSETLKRDRMPDLDKALGLPKGRAEKEADALLAAPAK